MKQDVFSQLKKLRKNRKIILQTKIRKLEATVMTVVSQSYLIIVITLGYNIMILVRVLIFLFIETFFNSEKNLGMDPQYLLIILLK